MDNEEYVFYPDTVEEALLYMLDVIEWNEKHYDSPKAIVPTHHFFCDLLQRFLVLEQKVRNEQH
jgi:hypothetical protein